MSYVPDSEKCKKCEKRVYPAEASVMEKQLWHQECLRCTEPVCNKKLTGSNWGGFVNPENKPYCNVHHKRLLQAAGSSAGFTGSTISKTPSSPSSQSSSTSSSQNNVPEHERCRKCEKRVYPAEAILMDKQLWHQDCLRCSDPICNKKLSGANWGGFVAPDNKPYCGIHLKRLVLSGAGPASNSSSSSSSTSTSSTTASETPKKEVTPSNVPESERCKKCEKRVYPAEAVVIENQLFHQDCLRCAESVCNKKISGANWGGFVGPENKPYCSIHHKRLLQAAGSSAGFSGSTKTSTWEAKSTSSPTSTVPESERCRKCSKRVYPAEAVTMERQLYHQDCLRCIECNKKLSGANWGAFLPPDNTPYCNVHIKRLLQSTGQGANLFSNPSSPSQPSASGSIRF